jgi:nitrogen fixation NifU-like protein
VAPLYSATILEHFRRPRNFGALAAADVVHEGANPLCGDRIRVELKLDGGVVTEARFRGDACAISTAAASLLMGRLHGMTVSDVERLGERDVLAMLDAEIAPARLACARLPLRVVHDGLRAFGDRRA